MIPQRIETLQKVLTELIEKAKEFTSYLSILETELLKYKEEYKQAQEAMAALEINKEDAIKTIELGRTIEDRENGLNSAHKAFEEEKTVLAKEKELQREKQIHLEQKEIKLNEKAERLQRVFNE